MIKKKKKGKALPHKQKSRAKYQCPELEELIYQANLVPIGTLTPDFKSEFIKEIQRLREETGEPSPKFSEFDFLENLIKHLPAKFLDYIKNVAYKKVFPSGENNAPGDDKRYRREFISQYVKYCEMRGSIFWLAKKLETEYEFPLTLRTVLERDNDGKLCITGLAALIGKFDDSRLRKCEICEKVFWAKRENSKTCSPECLNRLNVRRHRNLTDEEKAEKKAQREANRELIKKGKAKPTKKGTKNEFI